MFVVKNDKEQLEKTGCLVVALLTHGDEDNVYMSDRSIKLTTVMSFFDTVNCPELVLKPKIFIFQVRIFNIFFLQEINTVCA